MDTTDLKKELTVIRDATNALLYALIQQDTKSAAVQSILIRNAIEEAAHVVNAFEALHIMNTVEASTPTVLCPRGATRDPLHCPDPPPWSHSEVP